MGFRTTWIAVKDLPLDDCLAALSYEKTLERLEHIEVGYFGIALGEWSLFVADGSDFFLSLESEAAKRLSKHAPALFFRCSDTVMSCELAWFERGDELWRIEYSYENGGGCIYGCPPAKVSELITAENEVSAEDAQTEDDPGWLDDPLEADEQEDDEPGWDNLYLSGEGIYYAVAAAAEALVGFHHEKLIAADDDDALPVWRVEKI